MKSLFIVIIVFFAVLPLSAKKVKFAVDMSEQAVSEFGVFVSGDFQAAAGFPDGDWQPNTTPLTSEDGTQIYSIVVEIPAFTKYEYKFLNGDQWYFAEFVPVESRVGYNFDDNRWIWVDSLADDTTNIGAVLFAGNSPVGKYLARFIVNMQEQDSINSSGVHLAGDFQGWEPAEAMLYSFSEKLYEIIAFLSEGTYEYMFFNGKLLSEAEFVPEQCASNGSRVIQITHDTVLAAVCFSECTDCGQAGIYAESTAGDLKLFPNPADSYSILEFNDNCHFHDISIYGSTGIKLLDFNNYTDNSLRIDGKNLYQGIFFILVRNNDKGTSSLIKLVIE